MRPCKADENIARLEDLALQAKCLGKDPQRAFLARHDFQDLARLQFCIRRVAPEKALGMRERRGECADGFSGF